MSRTSSSTVAPRGDHKLLRNLLGLLAVAIMAASASSAKAPVSQLIFRCMLGKKMVSVTRSGDDLIYRFGTPARAELSITGGPNRHNLFYMEQQYTGKERQLRFTRDGYSYVVFTVDGNGQTDIPAYAGLSVKKGLADLAFMTCVRPRQVQFGDDYDFARLPKDDPKFTGL